MVRSSPMGRRLLVSLCLAACTPADADAIVISREAPTTWASEDAIRLEGRRWYWTAIHGEEQTTNHVALPVGRPTRLTVVGMDREHRLYFPTLGLDVVAVPGKPVDVWVTMQREGDWRSRCVRECLPEHPEAMTLELLARPPDAVAEFWLDAHHPSHEPVRVLAEIGARIFGARGCASCHALDEPSRGPPMRQFWGSTVVATDGRSVRVEGEAGAALIRDSLFRPNVFVVQGYPAKMPDFTGQLDAQQAEAVVFYLRCLAEPDWDGCEQRIEP